MTRSFRRSGLARLRLPRRPPHPGSAPCHDVLALVAAAARPAPKRHRAGRACRAGGGGRCGGEVEGIEADGQGAGGAPDALPEGKRSAGTSAAGRSWGAAERPRHVRLKIWPGWAGPGFQLEASLQSVRSRSTVTFRGVRCDPAARTDAAATRSRTWCGSWPSPSSGLPCRVAGTTVWTGLGLISRRPGVSPLDRRTRRSSTRSPSRARQAERGTVARRQASSCRGLTATRRSSQRPTEPWKVSSSSRAGCGLDGAVDRRAGACERRSPRRSGPCVVDQRGGVDAATGAMVPLLGVVILGEPYEPIAPAATSARTRLYAIGASPTGHFWYLSFPGLRG